MSPVTRNSSDNNFLYQVKQFLQLALRISYLRQAIPQASLALFILSTIQTLSPSLSLNTLSKDIFPSSDLIVVWAIWTTANSGSSTPYEARNGLTTLKYNTPSIFNVTLSTIKEQYN